MKTATASAPQGGDSLSGDTETPAHDFNPSGGVSGNTFDISGHGY